MSWTEKTQQGETWAEKSRQAETWSAASEQSETWTNIPIEESLRVFTPRVFSSAVVSGRRVFDTGASSGLWDERSEQSEVWVAV